MVPTIVAAVAACLVLALLALVLKRLEDLRAAIARSADKPPLAVSAVASDDRLAKVEDRLLAIVAMLGRVEATLANPRKPAPPPPAAPAEPRMTNEPTPPLAASAAPPLAIERPVEPVGVGARPADPPPAARTEIDAGGGDPETLMDAYRALIAEPRKAEINAWVETVGGEGCELGENGDFALIPRESSPLLILVPFDERAAMVVPSARLVLDFPTSFADSLTLRQALRHSFELTADGSGLLRVVQPAIATRADGTWQLNTPGLLGGLAN